MAKFLETHQIVSEMIDIIKNADKVLYLVSPYLQIDNSFRELITTRNRKGHPTVMIYRDNKLSSELFELLSTLNCVALKHHPTLHAKCYVNDRKLIITSLNFYEASMKGNREMGVLYELEKIEDKEIYLQALEFVQSIEDSSHLQSTIAKVTINRKELALSSNVHHQPKSNDKKDYGFCIRTGAKIPFNIERPLSLDAYREWSYHANPHYEERYCHFSGESSKGATSFDRPILNKNWKKAKEFFDLA